MRIAFLGFGTVGQLVCKELCQKENLNLIPVGFFDPYLCPDIQKEWVNNGMKAFSSIEELIKEKANIDVLLEATNINIAKTVVPKLLEEGMRVIVLSVGAFLDSDVYKLVQDCAKKNRGQLLIPSGALPGADVVKAAMIKKVYSIELTTRKHPVSLQGAPGLARFVGDLNQITSPTVVFHGNAREGVNLFPKNVNLVATLSLLGLGPEETKLTIIADPDVNENIHTLKVDGEFGKYEANVRLTRSNNPKTSLMPYLSVMALIKDLIEPIKIGT